MWIDEKKRGGGCGMMRTRIWNDEKKEEEDVEEDEDQDME